MTINLLDKIKYLFRKDKALYSSLYRILGFYPHNIEIYRTAFSHRSLARRNEKGKPLNNERLEFLGDAILEAVVSDILFRRYENKREGFLTSTRSKLVSRGTLNRLASELGIDKLIKSSARLNTPNNNLGGNAFEALCGAIYLDRGYGFCKCFVERLIKSKMLDVEGLASKEVNFKSSLLEWSQKNRIKIEFTPNNTEKPGSNSPVFYSTVVLEGVLAGEGKGFSKKESQQLAAKDALTKMRRSQEFVDSIFREKEKRTAMGAEEFSAVPQIEEIEESLSESKIATTERRTPAAEENAGEKKPRRRGRRRTPQRAPEQEKAQQTEPVANEAEAPAPKKSRSRSSRRRNSPGRNGGENKGPETSREDIIRAAEEAAFK